MTASPITDHVLVPVATVEDAETTAEALSPYSFDRITVLHVVEKGGGVPDKTPVEQSEQLAAEAFDAFREWCPDIETKITYRRDVIEAIFDVAAELNASAIAFHPRGGSRIIQLLSGDRSLRLVTGADRPVIALPERGDA